MASMLEKLGAMFEDDTTSVSISADVSVSEGSEVETVEEVQEYAEASEVVEEASQQLEEATQQMEDTAEAAETAAELRANISQYGINKQAAALIYQFYGIDKVGSFVTPSVESIDTVGRNYSAANQLMAALEEAEKKSEGMLKRAWKWIQEKAEKLWEAVTKFVKAIGVRVKSFITSLKGWAYATAHVLIPNKVLRLVTGGEMQRAYDKLQKAQSDTNSKPEDVEKLTAEWSVLAAKYSAAMTLDYFETDGKIDVAEAKKADTGALAKFVSICWDIVSYIPKKIFQFIDWIKSRWNRVSSEVKSEMEAEKQKDDQKKAGFFSRCWTAVLRTMKTIFRFFFSWGKKAEKEAKKEENKRESSRNEIAIR